VAASAAAGTPPVGAVGVDGAVVDHGDHQHVARDLTGASREGRRTIGHVERDFNAFAVKRWQRSSLELESAFGTQVQIDLAHAACNLIDALNGEPDFDVTEAEDGLWDAIEDSPSAPCFYAATRTAGSYIPQVAA
jgi:hypothetical protein